MGFEKGVRLINLFTEFMNDEDYNKIIKDYRIREYGGLHFSSSNYSDDLQKDYPDVEILKGEGIIAEIISEKYDIYDVDVNIAFIDSINNYINVDFFHSDFKGWVKSREESFLELNN